MVGFLSFSLLRVAYSSEQRFGAQHTAEFSPPGLRSKTHNTGRILRQLQFIYIAA